MKHLLNNMSEEEKNAIREQHTGGKIINTEKFSKLLDSKLGDVKPLSEQTRSGLGPMGTYPKERMSSSVTSTETAPAPTSGTTTSKTTGVGEYSGDLVGKTANFYLDKENKNFVMTGTIKNIEKTGAGIDIKAEFKIGGDTNMGEYFFDCETKEFKFMRGDAPNGYYSNNLANELTKRFCDKSSGGTDVPSADFLRP